MSSDAALMLPFPRLQRPRRRKIHQRTPAPSHFNSDHSLEEEEHLEYDTDNDSLLGLEDEFSEVDDDVDDRSFSLNESFHQYSLKQESLEWKDVSAAERNWRSTDAVDESKCQVSFCETTVQEMNQIMNWWSSNQLDNDVPEDESNHNLHLNSLLLEEEGLQEVLAESPEQEEISPNKPTSAAATETCEATVESSAEDDTTYHRLNDSNNLLIDRPLPQDVAFFSPVQNGSFMDFDLVQKNQNNSSFDDLTANEDMTSNDAHIEALEQHDQITRLLFQTQDMADQIAMLTETSATEEEESHDGLPRKLFQSPIIHNDKSKSILRQSNFEQKAITAPERSIERTNSEESNSSLLQLQWSDHGWIWIRRVVRRLETAIVSSLLTPVLPLSVLLFLVHRPKLFRHLLLSCLTLVFVVVPLLCWYWFAFCIHPSKTLPCVQHFIHQPYYTSGLHYSLQVPPVCKEIYVDSEILCYDSHGIEYARL